MLEVFVCVCVMILQVFGAGGLVYWLKASNKSIHQHLGLLNQDFCFKLFDLLLLYVYSSNMTLQTLGPMASPTFNNQVITLHYN